MHLDLWTLALQAANFLILVWLLHRFLYRPVLTVLARRQATADALIENARAEKQNAADLRKSLEKRQAQLAADRDAMLSEARGAAENERRSLLAQAQAEAEAARQAARAAFEQDQREAARALGRQAARLACAITERLLREEPSTAVQDELIRWVCDDVRALPPETKAVIEERVDVSGRPVDVITAGPLDPAKAERFSAALHEALGAPVALAFKVDPTLLAGIEIHFPFTVLRRTWAENLRHIQTELDNDDHAIGTR